MGNERRNFMKAIGLGFAATALSAGSAEATVAEKESAGENGPSWGMVVDLRLCIGCQACTVACSTENQIPLGYFRTIVSNYEVTSGNKPRRYTLPRLCNHCAKPACVTVCPTQATTQRPDGTVVVDNSVCIGCGYCIQACPYDARFINPKTKTADKCTFCLHRIEAGLLPACVETCVTGARVFGDLNNPKSTISKLLATMPTQVLKKNMGTKPHVFYIALDTDFSSGVKGQQVLNPAGQAEHQEVSP